MGKSKYFGKMLLFVFWVLDKFLEFQKEMPNLKGIKKFQSVRQ